MRKIRVTPAKPGGDKPKTLSEVRPQRGGGVVNKPGAGKLEVTDTVKPPRPPQK